MKLDESLLIDPSQYNVRLEYATTLLFAEKNRECLEQIAYLKEQGIESPQLTRIEAILAERDENFDTAVVKFQSLFEREPNNFNLIRLANATWKIGKRAESVALLESWLEEYPDDELILMELGGRYISQGNTKKRSVSMNTL